MKEIVHNNKIFVFTFFSILYLIYLLELNTNLFNFYSKLKFIKFKILSKI